MTMYDGSNTWYCWYVRFVFYDICLIRTFPIALRTIWKHKLSRTTRSHHFLFTGHVARSAMRIVVTLPDVLV